MSNDPVARTNPYPDAALARLSVDAEGHALLDEVLATRAPRRGWVPVAAAAAVVALVAGGAVAGAALLGDSGDPGPSASTQPAASLSGTPAPTPTVAPSTSAPVVDPGLPPTSANLHQVVLRAAGWRVTSMSTSGHLDGSIAWTNGTDTLELTWYAARMHPAYLTDRRAIGNPRALDALGQRAETFATTYRDDGTNTYGEMGDLLSPTEGPDSPTQAPATGPLVTRVNAIFPPVGDRFIELDGTTADRAAFETVVSQLTRVSESAWLAAVDEATVTPAEAGAFLAESSRGVTLPPGLTVTAADLRLPQSDYHARVTYIATVLCAWADRYVAGDDAALAPLRAAGDWPVVKAVAPEGGYADAVRDGVRELEKDKAYPYAQTWGCS